MRTILYLTYDGLTDPLGQSQILAYLKRLTYKDNRIVIVSFEKPELFARSSEEIRRIVEDNGLTWVPLTYTKRPPVLSTVLDIRKGWKTVKDLHREYKFDIVHCRGYLPALLGRKLKKQG